jgi:hypothetical protein
MRPRNRLVYFRLSEDEFQELNELCRDASARSISDVARQAVQNMIQNHRKQPSAEPAVAVQVNMERLVEMIEHLIQRVQGCDSLLDRGSVESRPAEEFNGVSVEHTK